MNSLKFIFVHGLSGWGSYDSAYQKMPYWGMRNGDLIAQLRSEGYDCCSASVGKYSSAYDRACELYAQLCGVRTDYGAVHSRTYGHPQYGRDFSRMPLIESFDDNTELVLLGHSFGGATIRVFTDILEHGRNEEATSGDSLFFKGGMGNRVFALVTLAAPHNGTTAYDLFEDPAFDRSSVRIPLNEQIAGNLMTKNNTPDEPLPEGDSASYDMHIDHALALNRNLSLSQNRYYFSQPCVSTRRTQEGICEPDPSLTGWMLRRTSRYMSAYRGKTAGGFPLDERWQDNDGLVNTVSAEFPIGNAHRPFDQTEIEPGIWNVFEPLHADHMALQGGLIKRYKILPYYRNLLRMITELHRNCDQ